MGWLLFETAIGSCGIAWNDVGMTGFQLPEGSTERTGARLCAKSRATGAMATPEETPAWVNDATSRVQRHLAGEPQDLTGVPIDFSGVGEFNEKVLRALWRVPAGETRTYGQLAREVGAPGAAQAVGRAMATNPFPVVVPCHRVVAANGSKGGGFSAYGGLVTKEKLLQLEGATLLTDAEARQTTLWGHLEGLGHEPR